MDMKIGQLAALTGSQAETIRFYEQRGLLPPPLRADNNYRLYGPAHAERLHFIRRCRALGMSLDEVQALLGFHDRPDEPCGGVNDLVDGHIGAIDRQIAELNALRDELSRLRARCVSPRQAGQCEILKGLGVPSSPA
ncbi:Cd(II)/Pb(II)-responsive transcriptional regulator [Pseudoduganella flava]|uniref:Cd(II)/Pb(II)-responsive transcriptional regulator n=3 Tax=Pseudoduganella flava TaxID=871742 RepID=A0A562PQE1_9BURK|nr:Cd(II)/Pb(II)-responsive transcriptional regulator [Pseudoduganella flava]